MGVLPREAVLSASRRTDVPAHFWKWFVGSFERGFFRYRHPFRGEVEVSAREARGVVFWSKYPAGPLSDSFLDDPPFVFYLLYTVNDYEEEGLEPNLPPLEERLRAAREWSRRFGRERLLWRFDPVVLGGPLTVEEVERRFLRLAARLLPVSRRLVFSFLDLYPKVRRRLPEWAREPTRAEMEELAGVFADTAREYGADVSACCEPEVSVPALGCVDPALLGELTSDPEFLQHLGFERKGDGWVLAKRKKDRGQRRECRCFPSVDVGTYSTCPFSCLYCYAR